VKNMWNSLGRQAKTGLITGALIISIAVSYAAFWIFKADYQTLFSGLSQQDASAMVGELDRMKIPYRLTDDGSAILVEKELVPKTRMALMGKELSLHGAVGLEIFNNSDFGMTEFAQKVNYQRAMQGEITRTISAFPEISAVRVHLALPEEGLFKRGNSKAKAAINLTLKPKQKLKAEQISGIQKLVSAAVPSIQANDVTIVDQHGVALSKNGADDGNLDDSSPHLDLKRETEHYLLTKANEILEKTYGPGQAIASVDVTLNMDQVRVTTEDVLGVPSKSSGVQTGVIVREKESIRDSLAPLDVKSDSIAVSGLGRTQRDVEYQAGRRLENVVSSVGAIKRLHVVAVVRKPLDSTQAERLKDVLQSTVGALPERGDTVVVQTIGGIGESVATPLTPSISSPQVIATEISKPLDFFKVLSEKDFFIYAIGGVLTLAVMLLLLFLLRTFLTSNKKSVPSISDEQRQLLLKKLEHWNQAQSFQEKSL